MKDRTFYVMTGFGVLMVFTMFAGRGVQPGKQSGNAIEPASSRSDYKVSTIATVCDITAQRSVKNPSSLSTAWSWKEVPTSRGVTIYRNFTAMNGFGANIDNYYVCSYDAISRVFVNFETHEGNY